MHIVSTCDLYEASYYFANKCTLEEVETFSVGNKLTCELFFKGEGIYNLRDQYLKGKAEVNLSAFRKVYSTLLNTTYYAKKEFKNGLKEGKYE